MNHCPHVIVRRIVSWYAIYVCHIMSAVNEKKGCHNVTALHVFINNCQISTIRYKLLIVNCQLSIVNCKPLILFQHVFTGIDDGAEVVGFEGGAANQAAVNIFLHEQVGGVFRVAAAPI